MYYISYTNVLIIVKIDIIFMYVFDFENSVRFLYSIYIDTKQY